MQEPVTNEHARAQFWRKQLRITAKDLGELTGYTAQTIRLMERGINSIGEPIAPWVWRRYKLVCWAIHAHRRGWSAGATFDWQTGEEAR